MKSLYIYIFLLIVGLQNAFCGYYYFANCYINITELAGDKADLIHDGQQYHISLPYDVQYEFQAEERDCAICTWYTTCGKLDQRVDMKLYISTEDKINSSSVLLGTADDVMPSSASENVVQTFPLGSARWRSFSYYYRGTFNAAFKTCDLSSGTYKYVILQVAGDAVPSENSSQAFEIDGTLVGFNSGDLNVNNAQNTTKSLHLKSNSKVSLSAGFKFNAENSSTHGLFKVGECSSLKSSSGAYLIEDEPDLEQISLVLESIKESNHAILEESFGTWLFICPNPTSGILNVSRGQNTLIVRNLTGLEVLRAENQSQIDLSSFPKGIYIVTVISGDETITERVILQ